MMCARQSVVKSAQRDFDNATYLAGVRQQVEAFTWMIWILVTQWSSNNELGLCD